MINKKIHSSFTRQQGQSDCGVACMASVIKYYGGDVRLEKLRELSGTNSQGTTLLGLYEAGQALGFDADGLVAEQVENLNELSGPAVLHVLTDNRLQHYVVFYGFIGQHVVIGDPAKGILKYSKEELENIWAGKALLSLTPNKDFTSQEEKISQKRLWMRSLLAEDLGVLTVVITIGIITALLSLSTAIFSQKLVDKILPAADKPKLLLSLILVVVLLCIRVGLSYLRGALGIHQGRSFNNRIIQNFYGTLLRLPKKFFDMRKTGELIARMNDTLRIQNTLSVLTGSFLIDALLIIASLIFIFVYSWIIGLVIIAFVPVYFWIALRLNKPIANTQREVMSAYAFSESHFVDSILGVESIKSSNKELFFENLNKKIYGQFQDSIFKLGKINIRFSSLIELFGVLIIAIAFGLTSWMVLDKKLTTGELVAVVSMVATITPAIYRLLLVNIQIQEARVVLDRMFEFISVPIEESGQETGINESFHFNSLALKNVSFRFPGRSPILRNVSFEVQKGECISILGESGCGKTTLLHILQKFYEPDGGQIFANDLPWEFVGISTWRNRVGFVSQDIKIFNGSLLYNICLSESVEEMNHVIAFLKLMGFDSYFTKLPQGYQTIVGEEGVALSGGQKQLVAMARALFNKPQLLLLDEATAAMDRNTEDFILSLLQKMKSEMGIVVVSHRIKAIKQSDRIYILEDGEIRHSGSPEKLLQSENLFSEMVMDASVN